VPRLALVVLLLAACAEPPRAPAPAAAPPAPAPAPLAAPDDPPDDLPAQARCSGRWTAGVAADVLRCPAYRSALARIDVEIASGEQGYEAVVRAPTGLTIERIDGDWRLGDRPRCSVGLALRGGAPEASLYISLQHGDAGPQGTFMLGARGDAPCRSVGRLAPAFEPDAAPLPGPSARLRSVLGDYRVAATWAGVEGCRRPLAPLPGRFTLRTSPDWSDAVVAAGTPYFGRIADAADGRVQIELWASESLAVDGDSAMYRETYHLLVRADEVEGTASRELQTGADTVDCSDRAVLRGTRSARQWD
jgi:hypothetical protein